MRKLTEVQKERLVDYKKHGFKYIARDINGHLYMYKYEPIKNKFGLWSNTGTWDDYERIDGSIFEFIDGTEELPSLITDLLDRE